MVEDDDVWFDCHEDDLWIFDKLILSRKLGYVCGPVDADVPKPNHYIVRPCVNPAGMGRGATIEYIDFGRKYFKDNKNVTLKNLSIYDLHKSKLKYDIVYSCNVILHLPELKKEGIVKITISKEFVLKGKKLKKIKQKKSA